MTAETTETTEAAHCPFCSKPMTSDSQAWRCADHKLSFLRCPKCGNPLAGLPTDQWCAWCRKWFNEKLEVK